MTGSDKEKQKEHVHSWKHVATKRVPIDTVHGMFGMGMQVVYEDKVVLTCDGCGETKTV